MDHSSPVLFSNLFEKEKTVETLIAESRADADFYLFLTFAAFITTLGLLLDNPVVIIGAMLVAPVLFPILSLGMGVVTSSREAISRSLYILFKSSVAIVLIAFFTSFIINVEEVTRQLELASDPNFLFFLIAFFSGIVASFSWVKQNTTTLPGVAITVALVPPLAAIGVGLSLFSRTILSGSLMLFIINLIGITLASVLVFSLFGFSGLRNWQDKKIQEEEKEMKEQAAHGGALGGVTQEVRENLKALTEEVKEVSSYKESHATSNTREEI